MCSNTSPPGALFSVMMYLGEKKKKNQEGAGALCQSNAPLFLHVQHVHELRLSVASVRQKGLRANYAYVCTHVHTRSNKK